MSHLVNGHLRIFVATRAEAVPADARPFLSVDGSVPGAALIWDHHVSGELVNLDAMPASIDLAHLRGVGTTLADTDAAVSVALVLVGGLDRVSERARAVLKAAAHWCDHLRPHPAVEGEPDVLGERLNAWASEQLRAAGDISESFAAVSRRIADSILSGAPLPAAEPQRIADAERARDLLRLGRVRLHERVALVDLRELPPIDPLATYALHRCPVAVTLAQHPAGGPRYTVGVNPFVDDHPTDLRRALSRLAAEEHRHGPPCTSPAPGAEGSWGGRATVFGSPWNYGSRLTPEEVVRLVEEAL